MANLKISQLPAAGALATTDVLPLVQGTTTTKATVANLDTRNDGRYLRKGQLDAPGSELYYAENTAPVTSSATTAAAAVAIFPGVNVSYDGGPVLVQAYSPLLSNATAGSLNYVDLWDGNTDLGVMGNVNLPNANSQMFASFFRRLTPSAGVHTYGLRLWVSGGTANFYGGPGGPGVYMQSFIRITKV